MGAGGRIGSACSAPIEIAGDPGLHDDVRADSLLDVPLDTGWASLPTVVQENDWGLGWTGRSSATVQSFQPRALVASKPSGLGLDGVSWD